MLEAEFSSNTGHWYSLDWAAIQDS